MLCLICSTIKYYQQQQQLQRLGASFLGFGTWILSKKAAKRLI